MSQERWSRIAQDSLTAAGLCIRGAGGPRASGHARSAVSRAYYAVFSMATAVLVRLGEAPPPDRFSWPHRRLPIVLRSALLRAAVPRHRVAEIVRNLRASYSMRLDADYQPGRTVDKMVATEALRQALVAITLLEKQK